MSENEAVNERTPERNGQVAREGFSMEKVIKRSKKDCHLRGGTRKPLHKSKNPKEARAREGTEEERTQGREEFRERGTRV